MAGITGMTGAPIPSGSGAAQGGGIEVNMGDPAKQKHYRPDIGESLTDYEYAQKRQSQQQAQQAQQTAPRPVAAPTSQQPSQGTSGYNPAIMSLLQQMQQDQPINKIQVPQFAPPPAAPPPAQIQTPDLREAQDAEFARAKDKVGMSSSAALASLRSSLGGRGMLGGQGEYRGTQNVATAGLGQLGDVAREQAIQGGAADRQQALAGYSGQVTQRGQDIGANEFNNSLASQQAQMSFDAQLKLQQAQQQRQLSILDALSRISY